MIPSKVITYLDEAKIKYEIVSHKQVFTAHDLAMTLHLAPKQIAKSLLLKSGADFLLAVLPADRNLDFKKLAKLIGTKKVDLPKEQVMKARFKVKPGALPAFGGLYKLPVYVDKAVLPIKKILLSSGRFVESILMSAKDYIKLEQAILGNYSVIKKIKKQPVQKKKTPKRKVSKKLTLKKKRKIK